jgi:ATP-dependent HslUV protease subunit HslV
MPRIPALAELPGRIRSTTILGLIQDGRAALGGDGQVTAGQTILKSNANKIRRLSHGQVLAGFAGAAADGLQLFERFEAKLETFHGGLRRAAVELAKDWRSDRVLRRLDAQLIALNTEHALLISGAGEVIEPDDGVVAIGSGGPYAMAACRALIQYSHLGVQRIVEESLRIASEICIYTGGTIALLTLPGGGENEEER